MHGLTADLPGCPTAWAVECCRLTTFPRCCWARGKFPVSLCYRLATSSCAHIARTCWVAYPCDAIAGCCGGCHAFRARRCGANITYLLSIACGRLPSQSNGDAVDRQRCCYQLKLWARPSPLNSVDQPVLECPDHVFLRVKMCSSLTDFDLVRNIASGLAVFLHVIRVMRAQCAPNLRLN